MRNQDTDFEQAIREIDTTLTNLRGNVVGFLSNTKDITSHIREQKTRRFDEIAKFTSQLPPMRNTGIESVLSPVFERIFKINEIASDIVSGVDYTHEEILSEIQEEDPEKAERKNKVSLTDDAVDRLTTLNRNVNEKSSEEMSQETASQLVDCVTSVLSLLSVSIKNARGILADFAERWSRLQESEPPSD